MKRWELTDDETIAIIKDKCPDEAAHIFDEYKYIAKAAQQKLMKHLYEKCYKHNNGNLRLGCPECLRELRKEFGL